jgi:hypothetical protein
VDLEISHADLEIMLIMTHNLRIVITVMLMVKMKNLFRLKDGLGPCLEDVNIE